MRHRRVYRNGNTGRVFSSIVVGGVSVSASSGYLYVPGYIASNSNMGFRISGIGYIVASGGDFLVAADGSGNDLLLRGQGTGGYVQMKLQTSAPADGTVNTQHVAFYTDESGSPDVTKGKYKDSTGATVAVQTLG